MGSTQTHLFQTGRSNSLPMPVYGVDSQHNDQLWGLSVPAGAPESFLVGGDVWRFSGMNAANQPQYQGYYTGQSLSLGTAGAGGGRLVAVTDPVRGNTSGLLNDVRAGTRLDNGTMVYAGGLNGTRNTATINNNSLAALNGNLDIPGNVLSLGALSGDAAAAGMTLQFVDDGATATLHNGLARPQAQWLWNRAQSSQSSTSLPVITLHSSSGLTLANPSDPTQAAIQLNPSTGTINLNGNAVLTQSTADARYLRSGSNGAVFGEKMVLNSPLDASGDTTGAEFEVNDDEVSASLDVTLRRPQAQWTWWKQDAQVETDRRAVMTLDLLHRLQLYPSTPSIYPGVVLSPSGVSSFKNPVRVAPGGDIPMGIYQDGTPP